MDWETTIQQLMAIERRRTVLLDNRKKENETKLSLWAQIQSKVALLQGAAQGIDTRSEFAVKSASSSDTTIVAVTADASAATGAHTVEALQLAKAHRIAAQGWADKNSTGVGDSGGNFVMTINGQTITVADADLSSATTLEQLRNLINSSPDNNDLVTASILDDGSSSNRYRLVLTSNDTGSANEIAITSNPTNLNFSTSAIDVAETETGWTGTSAITTGGTYSGSTNKTYSFTIGGTGTQTIGVAPINVNWVDSLGNTGTVIIPGGYGGTPITVAEGVELTFGSGDLVGGETFDTDVFTPQLTAAQDAQVKIDGIYLSASSNSISDVLEGVTLDLLSAEVGTSVEISISNDKEAVKAKIQSFVNAYNSLRSDLATFSSYDEENEAAAPLLGDGFLSAIKSTLANATSQALNGLPTGARFDSLAVVGIKGSTNGTLSIDSTILDNALDDHFDDVVNLFTQSFSSDDSKISFVSGNENTVAGEYTLVVNYDALGNPTSATINGVAATIDGLLIQGAADSSVEGLTLSFTSPGSGPGSVNTAIRYGKGVAATVAGEAVKINDSETGTVHFATDSLNSNIESIDRQLQMWEDRLQIVEDRLRRQFSLLETTLSRLRSQSNYLSGVL
jgi:flagellar hook-associated protein 2